MGLGEPEPAEEHRHRGPRLASLSFAHLVVDGYGSFLAPIVALVLAPRFGLGDDGAARLLALNVLLLSLGQPVFGYLSDRWGGRGWVILAPAAAGLSAGSFLSLGQFGWVVVAVVVNALAIAAFHPEAVALSGALDRRGSTTAMAVFMASGPVGLSLGPLVVTWAARHEAVQPWLPWLGVAASALLAVALPRGGVRRRRLAKGVGLLRSLRRRWKPLTLLGSLAAIRYFIAIGLSFALPVLLRERLPEEQALARSGLWLALFLGCSALGGIAGAALLSRSGARRPRRRSVIASLALAVVPLVLLPWAQGPAALAAVAAAGLALGWANPTVVAMGHRATPEAAAVASSLILGFSWSLGGPVAPVVFEAVAGAISLTAGLEIFALAAAIAAGLGWLLPEELEAEAVPALQQETPQAG